MDPWVVALIVVAFVLLGVAGVAGGAAIIWGHNRSEAKAAQERREIAARMAYQLGAPETAERILRQGKQE